VSAKSWAFEESPAADQLLRAIRQAAGSEPFDLAIVLGSGWGDAVDETCCLAEFAYRDWSWFPVGQIAGHAGRLQVLSWQGRRILAFQGRWHCYQGLGAYATTAPVRLAARLETPRVVLTCAAGGINPAFAPGEFMLVSDHLNLLGENPLQGLDAAFVDLSTLYQTSGFEPLAAIARAHRSHLHRGVLAAMPGPSYETPAEIVMLERLGADAVAMSTIPEAIMARRLGQEVVALALIANPAAGRAAGPIDHAEVLECGGRAAAVTRELLATLINHWQ